MVADQYAARSREVEEYKKFAQVPLLNQGQGVWPGQLGSLTTGGMPFSGISYTMNAQHIPANYTSGAQALQLLGMQKG